MYCGEILGVHVKREALKLNLSEKNTVWIWIMRYDLMGSYGGFKRNKADHEDHAGVNL